MILVVGDSFLDIDITSSSLRDNAEGSPYCTTGTGLIYHPGGAALVAEMIRGWGVDVDLESAIGNDHFGDLLLSHWHHLTMKTLWRTITKIRAISSTGDILGRIDCEEIVQHSVVDDVSLDGVDVLVISDYNKGVVYAGE